MILNVSCSTEWRFPKTNYLNSLIVMTVDTLNYCDFECVLQY